MDNWVHIIGAGAAGLSLGRALARYPQLPGTVLISDPFPDSLKTKGFGDWFSRHEETFFEPDFIWDRWSFSSQGKGVLHRGESHRYGYTEGATVYERAMAAINAHPQITLSPDRVSEVSDSQYIFDSRPIDQTHYIIKQAFVGYVIETQVPHGFEHVQLMEDIQPIAEGCRFRYLLPYTPTKMLVEYTDFTAGSACYTELKASLDLWCDLNIPAPFSVLRVEQATIPMGLKGQVDHIGTPIGVRGGCLRDATGYSYKRCVNQGEALAQHLMGISGGSTFKAPSWERWMDSRLLWLIKNRPEMTPSIFMTLASNLKSDQFAQFMANNDIKSAMRVVVNAPKVPFVRSVFGHV